jgi:glycosyltransferase involved in cell wall biosynthesis
VQRPGVARQLGFVMSGRQPMHVTLVVPTYQEAENIGPFLRAARAALPDARVIVCDDGSPDGTGTIAENVGAEPGQIKVLSRPGKEGLGQAYRHGFRVALDGALTRSDGRRLFAPPLLAPAHG